MHIPSLKKYITMTYKKFSENQLAHYWNLGYLNALRDRKLITDREFEILDNYNSKIYDKFFREIGRKNNG